MAVNESYLEFVREQLAGVGPIAIKRMFGGAGVFSDGLMFGLIADETLYFKADAESEQRFADEGMGPFTYQPKSGKAIQMSYWRVPERLYDEPDEMTTWAHDATGAARRANAAKSKRATTANKSKKKKAGA
ncbi:MAG TPA: TfoX/Sxy family protein [Hyphomicrobiaceae bacterium]|nr:TfoX/Sxy family protein [Hyphomicrobiaceae bacterium]